MRMTKTAVIVIIPKDFVDAGYVVVGRKHKINIELMDEEPLD